MEREETQVLESVVTQLLVNLSRLESGNRNRYANGTDYEKELNKALEKKENDIEKFHIHSLELPASVSMLVFKKFVAPRSQLVQAMFTNLT